MRIARPALAAFLLWPVLALGTGAQASGSPEPKAARRPPRPVGYPVLPGIWSLSGNDPGLAAGDLAPLQRIVGNATVVGLGEAVHTSGGFYRMKHRLLRYLVETMGFRAFAIESPWIAADSVAAYVQTCEGTPEDAMKGLFGVWQSTEVRDMVQWMCEWNRSHRKAKDKVSFFGFDIQQPQDDKPALAAFLARISADPLAGRRARGLLRLDLRSDQRRGLRGMHGGPAAGRRLLPAERGGDRPANLGAGSRDRRAQPDRPARLGR